MNSNGGLISNVNAWLAKPFNSQGSAMNWFLFVGFFMCVSLLWTRILADLQRKV